MTQIMLEKPSELNQWKRRMEASEKFIQIVRACINAGHDPVHCPYFAMANDAWRVVSAKVAQ